MLIAPAAEAIVIDIGTGDGRFMSTAARANPNKFFIGVDANVGPLKKPSMRATRKPAKGGLPNVVFVQAAVEDLPEELNGLANEIHINFPWGSLLKAVATGDSATLRSLHRISRPLARLEIVIGIDHTRDAAEIARLLLQQLTPEYLSRDLIPAYLRAGFEHLESSDLDHSEWSRIETTWARRLQGGSRQVTYLNFVRKSK
jgi:16S rRNA (adenine(1408)-N(1))-methyltransferase